jgi:hypothetical protein
MLSATSVSFDGKHFKRKSAVVSEDIPREVVGERGKAD